MKYKICIWTNIPSHYQRDFFSELYLRKDIDLAVKYINRFSENRKNMGWEADIKLKPYENFIDPQAKHPLFSITNWKDSIHVIPGLRIKIMNEILDLLIKHNVRWVHWSERSGVNLARFFKYNDFLFNFFLPFFLYLRGYNSYAKKVNKYALGAFAQGHIAKNDFIKWGIHSEKIEYLFYSPKSLELPKDNIQKKFKSFCYLGSLSQRKGLDLLIKAFYKLNYKSDWKLIIGGPDESNGRYFKQVQKLNLSDKIEFTGSIPSNSINNFLAKADVFVFPSRFDGWGVVLNEAASLSKPIIASCNTGAAHHLIKNNKNGFIVKSNTTFELEKAMQFYINNPEMIKKHGVESYNLFQQHSP